MTMQEMFDMLEEYNDAMSVAVDATYSGDSRLLAGAWDAADAVVCEIKRSGFKTPRELAKTVAIWRSLGQV